MYDYSYYNDALSTVNNANNLAIGSIVWLIITFVAALIGCFVVYFAFVKRNNEPKNKFAAWLKEFLDFKKLYIEDYIKISYIFAVILITLGSFAVIGNFLSFLCILIFGNLIARVTYELLLLTILIWKNTSEINKKLK